MEHIKPRLDELKDRVKRAAEDSPGDTYRRAGYDGELKTQGNRLVGLCPFHDERTPSFTVYADGGFYCFGCGVYGDIVDFHQRLRSLPGFTEAVTSLACDLGFQSAGTVSGAEKFAEREEPKAPYTLYDYAAHVLLPTDELQEWGVCDGVGGHVLVFYRDRDGRNLRARVRHGSKRWWGKPDIGGERSYLYGLDRPTGAQQPIIIVEGESDCQVLWHCGLTALGAPGQTIFKADWVDDLPPCEQLYILREPNATLPETVAKAFTKAGPPDAPQLLEFSLEDGDALDLWREVGCDVTAFRECLEAALAEARPVAPTSDEPDDDFLKKSVAVQLVEITLQHADPLFLTPEREPFVRVPVGDHREILRLRDGRFREWAEGRLYQRTGRGAHDHGLSSARAILAGHARQNGTTFPLHNRVAWQDGRLLYDLTDPQWRVVSIGADGWQVVDDPPILFQRHQHQQPQVTPERNGDAARLLDFVNVPDEGRLLLLVYTLSCLVPDIPHPIPVFAGPQGSAKTTAARVLRRIIDPSTLATLTFPRSQQDLVQQLHHHWFAVFDNVSSLPIWLSDALCRASTGEGYSKRQLWTDDQDVIFAYRRCVGLTAIHSPVTQADLFDRCIILNLERVPDNHRQRERDFWTNFDAALPAILGGVFDAMSEAVRVYPSLTFDGFPRMADFAAWGAAIAIGLGYTQETWMQTYDRDIAERDHAAVEASPFASAVAMMMDEHSEWEGTATDLLQAAEAVAEREHLGTDSKAWPGSASWASKRLDEAAVNLVELGILVESDRDKSRRTIRLTHERPNLKLVDDGEDPWAREGDAQ